MRLSLTRPATRFAMSGDEKYVCAAGSDGSIEVFELGSGRTVLCRSLHEERVTDVQFLDAGGHITLTVSLDGSAVIYDVDNDKLVAIHRPGKGPLWSVCGFRSDHIIVGSQDGWSSVLHQDPERPEGSHNGQDFGAVLALGALQPTGDRFGGFVAAYLDGSVALHEKSTSASGIRERLERHTGPVTSLAVDPAGRLLSTASSDGSIAVWDIQHSRLLLWIPNPGSSISAITHLRDGDVATVSTDGQISRWSISTGQRTGFLSVEPTEVLSRLIQRRDGTLLALCSNNRCIRSVSFDTPTVVDDPNNAVVIAHAPLILPDYEPVKLPEEFRSPTDEECLRARAEERRRMYWLLFEHEFLHPSVRNEASGLFLGRHYGDAVLAAFRALEMRVKTLSKSEIGGQNLMGTAFSEGSPLLDVRTVCGPTGIDQQLGTKFLAMGAMAAIRNVLAHDNGHFLTADEAIEALGLASLLARRLDIAEENMKPTGS